MEVGAREKCFAIDQALGSDSDDCGSHWMCPASAASGKSCYLAEGSPSPGREQDIVGTAQVEPLEGQSHFLAWVACWLSW